MSLSQTEQSSTGSVFSHGEDAGVIKGDWLLFSESNPSYFHLHC